MLTARRRAALVVLLATIPWLAGPSLAAQTAATAPESTAAPRVTFDAVYRAYVAGDHDAVWRLVQTREDHDAIRPDLFAAIATWRGTFSRAHATLLLEIAANSFERELPDAFRLLEEARSYVIARPADTAEDAFELLFHKAALALTNGFKIPDRTEIYLKTIGSRLSTLTAPVTGTPGTDARFMLARAVARELRTQPGAFASWALGGARRDQPAGVRLAPVEQLAIEDAIQAFDQVPLSSETVAEVNVRRAYLLYRLGRFDEALASLDRDPLDDPDIGWDPHVKYWGLLIRGKVLEALKRPAESVAPYQAALALAPQAQTPAVALAAISLRLNRPEDAERWAMAAMAPVDRPADPWWDYWLGDQRLLRLWILVMRRGSA